MDRKRKPNAGLSALKTTLVFWFLVATVLGVYFFADYIHNDYKIEEAPRWEESSVSAGAPRLPDLVGKKWTESLRQSLLEGKSGVSVIPTVVYKPDSSAPHGTVVAQHPAANSEAVLDSDGVCRSVTVTVSGDGLNNRCIDFAGYVPEKVIAWLESCGVKAVDVKRSYALSETVVSGRVISLDYADGSAVPYGEVVSADSAYVLRISTTMMKTTVPLLVDCTETDARTALASAMLNVGKITTELSTKPTGTVLKQSSPEGTVLDCGAEVDLVISEQSTEQFAMPNLMGMDVATAELALQIRNLKVGSIIKQKDYHYDENAVIGQSIAPGAPVSVGTTVSLTIAVGGKSDTNVDWDGDLVFINLEANTVVSHATLDRIDTECVDKTVLIGVRESYMWFLPVGVSVKETSGAVDMKVLFDENCDNYDDIEDALRADGVSSRYRFVFSAPAAPSMGNGVKLEIKLGAYFANKKLELRRLDDKGELVPVDGSASTADGLGYASFTVASAESYAVVIVD